MERIVIYDKVAIPMIIDYKWEEAKCEKLPKLLPSFFPTVSQEEQDRRFELLHNKHAKPIFDVFMELGGFYYKSGQKIAVRAQRDFDRWQQRTGGAGGSGCYQKS